MAENLKKIIIPFVVACIHFALSVVSKYDSIFFDYNNENLNVNNMIVMKVIYFVFLIIAWNFIFFITEKIKNKVPIYIRGFKIFCIYLSIITLILLCVSPGLWEDLGMLETDSLFIYFPWQHILSSMEHILYAQILPFAGGILFVRQIIISCCIAYIITQTETTFNLYLKNKFLDLAIKLLPFLMFPVIRYQLTEMRMGLYVYLEAVMLFMVICAFHKKSKWTNREFLLFAFLGVLCSVWRTEGLIYYPFLCLLLLFMKYLGSFKKRFLALILITFGVFFITNSQQKLCMNNYIVVSTVRQCAEIVKAADLEKDKNLLQELNRAVYVDVFRKETKEDGEILYWTYNMIDVPREPEDYIRYHKALTKLCLKYPKVFFKERTNLFLKTSAIKGRFTNYAETAKNLLTENNSNYNFYNNLCRRCFLNKPLSSELRNMAIDVIYLERTEGRNILFRIVWNFLPPAFALFVLQFIMLIKRKWEYFIIGLPVLLKFIIVFLTAPAIMLMYYLTFYLLGYIVIADYLIYFIGKMQTRQNQ